LRPRYPRRAGSKLAVATRRRGDRVGGVCCTCSRRLFGPNRRFPALHKYGRCRGYSGHTAPAVRAIAGRPVGLAWFPAGLSSTAFSFLENIADGRVAIAHRGPSSAAHASIGAETSTPSTRPEGPTCSASAIEIAPVPASTTLPQPRTFQCCLQDCTRVDRLDLSRATSISTLPGRTLHPGVAAVPERGSSSLSQLDACSGCGCGCAWDRAERRRISGQIWGR
jgi:hypothetical protein